MKLSSAIQNRRSRRRGVTLVETVVSIGILAFIISFVAFLVFMGTINAYNVHDQVKAQTSASTATERIATLLREASHFSLCSGDSITSGSNPTFSRIQFTVPPLESSMGAVTTSVLCWHPGNPNARPPLPPSVLYFRDASDAMFSGTVPTGTPGPSDMSFPNINTLEIRVETWHRLQVSVGYEYRGFAMVFKRPEAPQLGLFTTDVVARNRFLPFGQTTAYSDSYDANVTTDVVHL